MTRPFSVRLTQTSPGMRLLNRVILAIVAVHVVLAAYSGYRAIVQIYGVQIQSPMRVLHAGSTVSVSVVTSGRTYADAELDLIQGTRTQKLVTIDLPKNGNASYDPRSQRGSVSVALTPEQLNGFQPGHAVLRATAYGRAQWLRTPPPTVRELAVDIQP